MRCSSGEPASSPEATVPAMTPAMTPADAIEAAISDTEADPRGAAALDAHGRPEKPRRSAGRPPLPPGARRVRVAGTVDPELAEWAVAEAAARDAVAAREGQRRRGLSGVIEDALAALRG